MNESESKYLDLCADLIQEIDRVHKNSRRYMKRALWSLLIVPVVLIMIIFLIDVSKITTMFVWLMYMFMVCAYLIFMEYTDQRLSARVAAILGREDDPEVILARVAERKAAREENEEKALQEADALEEAEAAAEEAMQALSKAADLLKDDPEEARK